MAHAHIRPFSRAQDTIPIHTLSPADLALFLENCDEKSKNWIETSEFSAKEGQVCTLLSGEGKLEKVLFGLGKGPHTDPFSAGRLTRVLPKNQVYAFAPSTQDPFLRTLGWALEGYDYTLSRKQSPSFAPLLCPEDVDFDPLSAEVDAVFLARTLVNTPANLLGPLELQGHIEEMGHRFGARVQTVQGQNLADHFPLIFAVGQAAGPGREPRLVELIWGEEDAPKVTLVGKGVCFDTGGLNIKPERGMEIMKKDMGGAASVLGLAQAIMSLGLRVRLRVLIPAVENAISGLAFRPGDVFVGRGGVSVEIGNTDAEGRLVLADALAYGDEEGPELLVDMATLTGAARVALGPDIPPFYTDDEDLACDLQARSFALHDPLWRLPLWRPYHRLFESPVADCNNAGTSSFAGSIVAALFLRRFVEKAKSYVHCDIYGWTPTSRPGRPLGGEAQGVRTLLSYLKERYPQGGGRPAPSLPDR